MNRSLGSYEFDTFQNTEQATEISRLERQVTTTLDLDRKIWIQAGLTTGMRVLDLGCGTGIIGCELAHAVQPGEVIGVDLSEAMVQQAQTLKASKKIANATFQSGDAYQLDFPDASFDFVYSRLLFQHLAEPLRVLAEIYRVLKPGGRLCVMDVDEGWFSLYPEPPSLTLLCQQLVTLQRSQGGDPYVGRKLGHHFQSAGFVGIQTFIHPFSSDEFGLKNLFDLLSFGTPYYKLQEDLAEIASRARSDVYSLLNVPYAWAGIGFFAVIGRRH